MTKVPRSRYPAIDMHTHLSWAKESSGGVSRGEEMKFLAKPEDLIPVMDRKNVRMMVNLTGGTGAGLAESIRVFEKAYPGRFATLTEPSYGAVQGPALSRRSRPTPSSRRRTPARAASRS